MWRFQVVLLILQSLVGLCQSDDPLYVDPLGRDFTIFYHGCSWQLILSPHFCRGIDSYILTGKKILYQNAAICHDAVASLKSSVQQH